MPNDLFKKYQNLSFKEIDIDSDHKKKLKQNLFRKKEAKSHFWTWTKAIFTAPVLAAFALIFILNSKQETVKQIMQPQEALAQAIKNTFDFNSFEKTFGLPNDGKFYHRQYSYNYENTDSIIDLWRDKTNIRIDESRVFNSWFNDFHLLNKEKMFISTLLNEKTYCEGQISESIGPSFDCFTPEEIKKTLAEIDLSPFFPPNKEDFIGDLTYSDTYDELYGPGFILNWSTAKPIDHSWLSFSSLSRGLITNFVITDDFNWEDGYQLPEINQLGPKFFNQLKNGRYWHRATLYTGISLEKDTFYFQIISDKESNGTPERKSMVYLIDSIKKEVQALSSQDFIEKIKEKALNNNISKQFFYRTLQPVIYILNHPEKFNEPIKTSLIDFQGEKIVESRYILPEAFFKQLALSTHAGTLIYIKPSKEDLYYIDFFFDQKQGQFLGYSIKKNESELESLWIQDKILPDAKTSQIFDENAWKEQFKS